MKILTSSIILLARTDIKTKFIFGAYNKRGEATSFVKLPEDHRMFVETLTGEQTVMGIKTLLATPLDFPDGGRICITHFPKKVRKDAIPATTIAEGIAIAKRRAAETHQDRIYVIGGASIISQCIEEDLLDEIKLTLTYSHYDVVENPVYLNFNIDNWKIETDSGILISKNSKPENLKYRYYTLRK